MTIYFFTTDPQTGILYAGCKEGKKRFISPVWKQGASAYVTTGKSITKDLEHHTFTRSQCDALSRFIATGSQNMEDWRGIK